MRFRGTAYRNRTIFADFRAGQSVQSLAQQHSLSAERIRVILTDEGNRYKFSPEPFYRALRSIHRPKMDAAP